MHPLFFDVITSYKMHIEKIWGTYEEIVKIDGNVDCKDEWLDDKVGMQC